MASVASAAAQPFRLSDAAKLPEAPEVPGRAQMAPPDRVGHVAHVEITVGIHRDAVGRDELARPLSLFGIAEASAQLPAPVVDGHPMAQPRRVVDATHAVQLPDEEVSLGIQADAVRAVDVVPHGDELAIGVEHLDAMSFPVRDVDAIIAVDDDIVGPDELTGIDARLAPREDV